MEESIIKQNEQSEINKAILRKQEEQSQINSSVLTALQSLNSTISGMNSTKDQVHLLNILQLKVAHNCKIVMSDYVHVSMIANFRI